MSKPRALRPAAMQSTPVKLDRVFDDPSAILALIKSRAPYVSLAEFHNMQDSMQGPRAMPWFRTMFDDEVLLQNPRWIESARQAFSAKIIRPQRCVLNLNGPMAGGAVHVDLPSFRGFAAPRAPVWLLMNMTASGLFMPWMIPIASGLAWFYRGVGGQFEYWADGAQHPPRVQAELWNTGVMSDNEFMWHSIAAIGGEDEQRKLRGALRPSDRLHALPGGWEIRDDKRVVAELSDAQVRISLLWKAQVFRDEQHLASFEDRSMDLGLDEIVDIYREDLARKGLTVRVPEDPFTASDWRETLENTYTAPFRQQLTA